MTTYFDFVASNVAPFQFQPTLDDAVYNCIVTWNVFGRRYYVSCYALDGTLVFSLPLLGSPGGRTIESLTWDSGVATAELALEHRYAPGSTVRMTISGANPAVYNGIYDVLIVDALSLTYSLAADPGPTVAPGSASRDLNIAGGFFNATLVYRAANAQFEVNP